MNDDIKIDIILEIVKKQEKDIKDLSNKINSLEKTIVDIIKKSQDEIVKKVENKIIQWKN